MDNKKDNYLTIVNEEGQTIECEILFTFDSDETKKSYIVYTDNTIDESGSTQVYASTYDKTGKDKTLVPIEDEKEWLLIENIFSSIQEKLDSEEDNNN